MFEYEFPYLLSDGENGDVVQRLAELVAIAAKLEKALWTTWFTPSGIGFSPFDWDEEVWLAEDPESDADALVEERLAELGIDEYFEDASRRLAEMRENELRMLKNYI